jgi:hypothetical protein
MQYWLNFSRSLGTLLNMRTRILSSSTTPVSVKDMEKAMQSIVHLAMIREERM